MHKALTCALFLFHCALQGQTLGRGVEAWVEASVGRTSFTESGTTGPLTDSLYSRGSSAHFGIHLRKRIGERFAFRFGLAAGWRDFGLRHVEHRTSISWNPPERYTVIPELEATITLVHVPLLAEVRFGKRFSVMVGGQFTDIISIHGPEQTMNDRVPRWRMPIMEGIVSAEAGLGARWALGVGYVHGLAPMWVHSYAQINPMEVRMREHWGRTVEASVRMRLGKVPGRGRARE